MSQAQVVVIGGGIAGLAAAAFLSGAAGGPARARVTVLEASGRVGGKLWGGEVGGVRVDLGAESMLARRPEGTELARAVGLAEELEAPTTAKAAIWTRGALRPLPGGQVMGVPGDLAALSASGVLTAAGLERARHEERTEVGEDVAIGRYVADRLGQEVVDRLVEPLLGGVYAGRADEISMRAAVPQLLPIARGGGSLVEGVHALASRPQTVGTPVFAGLRGGLGTLPEAVAEACVKAGVDLRTDAPVAELRRTPEGWRVVVNGEVLHADAVVLAAPAPEAARLLRADAPAAAAELDTVEYAGMALVTLAFRRADLAGLAQLQGGSGFLVPPVDGRRIKASTFSSNKWGWLERSAPDAFLLRTSLGRHREEEALELPDEDLVARSLADLKEAVGLTARPYDTFVSRFTAGLPQYPVGHLDRVARVRAATDRVGALAVCGAAYDGVGIPACIASAAAAAAAVDRLLTPATGEGSTERTMGA
ncbi:protoporphyrinogen oxidase [Streptomyces rubellomurinus]|uniref:Coproporphyrinogen III oxidase n=1 Tax=Streptomyces rubellomurinus (strain ATCC 31215) TaxID=359131 RepID=A0A0F2T5Q6_STRR3|nr:protoporphyrinogen oxidase [Streptomyces rubellomurinus]KJS58518.1 protoporphyrinogen oxidase [Streptomyces rubellomurinus]